MINDTDVHRALVARETKPIELIISPLDLDSRKVRGGVFMVIYSSLGNIFSLWYFEESLLGF